MKELVENIEASLNSARVFALFNQGVWWIKPHKYRRKTLKNE
jgi:hypothetical protein